MHKHPVLQALTPIRRRSIHCRGVLTCVDVVQASPDPPVSITNGVALFQGNQSNGIVSGVDFNPPK